MKSSSNQQKEEVGLLMAIGAVSLFVLYLIGYYQGSIPKKTEINIPGVQAMTIYNQNAETINPRQ